MNTTDWEIYLQHQIEDTIAKVHEIVATTEKLSVEDFEEYEMWSQLYIKTRRDIEKCKIRMKHDELLLQKEYAEQGIKAIKTREQMARDDFTQARVLLEEYKEVRDELALRCEIQRYVMGID